MALDSAVRGISGLQADVDTNNNMKVNLPVDVSQSGFGGLMGELASASCPTGRLTEKARISAQGRIAVGEPVPFLNEVFSGFGVNSAIWSAPVTTMAIAAGTTTINLNSAASTTAAGVARLSTYQFFPFYADMATVFLTELLYTQPPQANCLTEFGLMQVTGVAAPSDGAFFRFNATGNFQAVLSCRGVEQIVAIASVPVHNEMHKYKIVCENDRILYYVNGACVAQILSASDVGMPFNAQGQPVSFRTTNPGTPSLGSIIKIGYVYVGMLDAVGLCRLAPSNAAFAGKMGSQGQSGMTMGSTANLTNSMALGAGFVLTNTTAAAGTGLGGQFTVQPTLAAGTDGILCSYLNPVATATLPGKTLYIFGVKIQGMVAAALTAGPGVFLHSLAYGHTALSLATTESATAKAPRRVTLGLETYPATAAIGVSGGVISMQFAAPIAVNPGEYVAIVMKFVAGTIFTGTTGLITYSVTFDSHWE